MQTFLSCSSVAYFEKKICQLSANKFIFLGLQREPQNAADLIAKLLERILQTI